MSLLDNLNAVLKQEFGGRQSVGQEGQGQLDGRFGKQGQLEGQFGRQGQLGGQADDSNAGSGFGGIFGQVLGGLTGGGSGSVLGSTALGGLVGALLGNKGLKGAAGGAILAGGIQLWNQYKKRLQEQSAQSDSGPIYQQPAIFGQAENRESAPGSQVSQTTDDQVERTIRALVYAAKSDGHIDADEQQAIMQKIQDLNLGSEGEALVRLAMDEPLDAARIAAGVDTAEDALQLFTISCAVVNVDNTMEVAYLDSLAKALNVPDDVKDDLLHRMKKAV